MPLAEAAKHLGLPVSIATVDRWARTGRIRATKVGWRWFIDPAELKAAVVSQVTP